MIGEAGGVRGENVVGFIEREAGGEGVAHPPEVPMELKVVGDNVAGEMSRHVEQRPVEGDEGDEQVEGEDDGMAFDDHGVQV